MARLLAPLADLARARIRRVARRARWRAVLIACTILTGGLAFFFALGTATVALANALGWVESLAIMAGVMLLLALILVAVLAEEARRERLRAAQRSGLDRKLARAALLSVAPTRIGRPPRGLIGAGLVALGALIILRRRDGE